MSKKAAWYSMFPPIVFVLVILTIILVVSGQATLQTFVVLVAAVLIGSVGGMITRAVIAKRGRG